MKKVITLLTMIVLLTSSIANASKNCSAKEYQQFDFWLGDWQVTAPNDKIVRFNKISKINDGCTLLEEYSSPSGYQGKSFNIYNKKTKQWHQTWVDSSGLLLELKGGLIGSSMVLQGKTTNQKKQAIVNKITWTPNEDKSVRQHWQVSKDEGKTWQTIFDGHYQLDMTK